MAGAGGPGAPAERVGAAGPGDLCRWRSASYGIGGFIAFSQIPLVWGGACDPRRRQRGQLAADMAPWGVSGDEAVEYSADCIATVWGAQMDNYWACPPAAQALVRQRLAGDWS